MFRIVHKLTSVARRATLNQIGDVGWKLIDLSVIETLDVLEETAVFASDKVDCHSLAAETPGSSDTVQIVLRLCGEIEVHDQRNLHACVELRCAFTTGVTALNSSHDLLATPIGLVLRSPRTNHLT